MLNGNRITGNQTLKARNQLARWETGNRKIFIIVLCIYILIILMNDFYSRWPQNKQPRTTAAIPTRYSNLLAIQLQKDAPPRPPAMPCRSWKVVMSPAVNHSSPPPAKAPFASPLACVGGSTSGLMAHVQAVHPDVINSSPHSQQCTLSSFCVGPHHPCPDSHQEQITGLISDMLVANMLPVSLVQSAEFRALLAFLEPAYKPQCRQTMTPFDNR